MSITFFVYVTNLHWLYIKGDPGRLQLLHCIYSPTHVSLSLLCSCILPPQRLRRGGRWCYGSSPLLAANGSVADGSVADGSVADGSVANGSDANGSSVSTLQLYFPLPT